MRGITTLAAAIFLLSSCAGQVAQPSPTEKIETSSAAVSSDARKLWFTAPRGVALVDTRDLDGRRLYALASDGTPRMIDATTGKQLGQMPAPGASALFRVASR
jgi:hypothetical protein